MADALRLRILVADDDETLRETLIDTLGYLGHEVAFSAANGREAIEKIERLGNARLDLVITDFRMPGGVLGTEVARAAKRNGIKVILITGDEPVTIMRSAEAAGVDKFLLKPFGNDRLRQAIAEVFAH